MPDSYYEYDGWYDSDFWNSFYDSDPVGIIDTSGNSAYLGFNIGNPGTSNPPANFNNMNEYDIEGEDAFSGFFDSVGNAFSSAAAAIGSAFTGAVNTAANAAGQNFANQITGAGNQVANNLGGANTPPANNANNANKTGVLIVGAVAVVALLAAVYFAGKSTK